MTTPQEPKRSPAETALLAARIFAADPHGTGICLRARPGPQREAWLALVSGLMADRPFKKMPLGITDDRLFGGLDLSATLAAGRPVMERGLLASADGGVLTVPSAERISPGLAARIAMVYDRGELRLERDGLRERLPARFGMILLDESAAPEEQPPLSLIERLALQVDLSLIRADDLSGAEIDQEAILLTEKRLSRIEAGDDAIEALCRASLALGIDTIRAPLMALRVARIAAALDGRDALCKDDLALAGELVLAWRTRRLPAPDSDEDQPADEPPPPDDHDTDDLPDASKNETADELSEIVVDAASAALPPDLLAKLKAGRSTARARSFGQAGVKQRALSRGRRAGVMPGDPRRGSRLDLVSTLRAAVPWQKLRRHTIDAMPRTARSSAAVQIRPADFRVVRFVRQAETLTVFAVDASGSQALHRMAEAKGAVERLLGECYIRRDQVALIVFGGKKADLILPPTRSLVRAKRTLTALPAGGGTPLASGIDAALSLARAAQTRGATPLIVFLTDGRANITRDGSTGRQAAQTDSLASARLVRSSGVKALLIDTAANSEPRAQRLAEEMGAIYLALPYLNAGAVSSAAKEARAL